LPINNRKKLGLIGVCAKLQDFRQFYELFPPDLFFNCLGNMKTHTIKVGLNCTAAEIASLVALGIVADVLGDMGVGIDSTAALGLPLEDVVLLDSCCVTVWLTVVFLVMLGGQVGHICCGAGHYHASSAGMSI
jgi:hypothetical protein